MKLTNKVLKQLIREAVFDYRSALDKRQEKYKSLDKKKKKKLDPMVVHSDPSVQAQGHELIDSLTGYERSGTEDIEGLKRFNLGQMYNMIPGLEEMGRSDIRDNKNFHDKLVQVLQSDTVELFLHQQERDNPQYNRIKSTGKILPEDIDNLYIYALYSEPSAGMTQDMLFDGLSAMAYGLDTIPHEKAIIEYVMLHAKNYHADILN